MRRVGIRGIGAKAGDRAVALPRARRDPGRGHAQAGHSLRPDSPNPNKRLGVEHIITIKGRRARNVRGSLHGDRPERWGAPVTGVCQRTLCACRIGCRVSTAGTDRSSSERWLERSSHPDLGSGCIARASRPLSSGLLAENTRPASPAPASAVSIASSSPSPLGGLRPALTIRPPPRASCPPRALIRGP